MSTLRVNTLQSTSTTDGGISIDTSGHVTVDGVAMPSSGPLSNRNLIINGAMQVAQRGTSQSSVTSTTYAGPDRFQHILATAGTWTISQSTDAPEGFETSLKLDCTTANASLSASSLYLLGQKIEGLNVQHLDYNTVNAKTVTLSFWVRSNKTGTYVFEVTSDTSTRKISQTYTINSANTWEKKILQIPGDTGGSLQNTNTAEFNVYWWVVAGTDFTSGTLNTTWGTTADSNRVVGQTVNLADSTDNDFYLTGVQLEVGSVATPFEHRSYGDELARCQRYFVKTFPANTAVGQNAGISNALGGVAVVNAMPCAVLWCFPVRLREAPSVVTSYNPTAANANWSANPNSPTVSIGNSGESSVTVFGLTNTNAGNGYYIHLTASAEL